jgi:demethylmenaquinone methyltransferase/2-methoxy-6-polyprenyl-1,4-benzoquinol methylase
MKLVRAVYDVHPVDVLDLATGSGDVAFALADGLPRGSRIIGVDFCQPMLDEAAKKQGRNRRWAGITFQQGDGLALSLPDKSFDAVTIAFGLRNMADRHRALSEMRRVLRPGGRLFVLEFSQPYPWFGPLYFSYLRHVSPWLARVVTGEQTAYEYLGSSIELFPDRDAVSAELLAAGFASTKATPLTLGTVALHEARSVE